MRDIAAAETKCGLKDDRASLAESAVARPGSGLHIAAAADGPRRREPAHPTMTKMPRSVLLTAAVLAVAACGDADSNDPRGYTKAPLEEPGWTVDDEDPTEMAELGEPVRVPSMDTAAAEAQPAPAAQPATNPQPGERTTEQPAAQQQAGGGAGAGQ